MMSRRYGRLPLLLYLENENYQSKNGIMVDKNNHPYLHISGNDKPCKEYGYQKGNTGDIYTD